MQKDLAELWLVEFVSVISNKLNIDKKKKWLALVTHSNKKQHKYVLCWFWHGHDEINNLEFITWLTAISDSWDRLFLKMNNKKKIHSALKNVTSGGELLSSQLQRK